MSLCRAGYREPCPTWSTSREGVSMDRAMACPCTGPRTTVCKISRSSVPCKSPDWLSGFLVDIRPEANPCSGRRSRGAPNHITLRRPIRFSHIRVFGVPGLDPRSHAALEMTDDLICDSSVDVLLFDSLHTLFSFTSGGTTSSPRSGELFSRGGPSRHRAAVRWLARASPLTAGRDASARGFRGGDEVRTRGGKE